MLAIVIVVNIQQLPPARVHVLVTLASPTHCVATKAHTQMDLFRNRRRVSQWILLYFQVYLRSDRLE